MNSKSNEYRTSFHFLFVLVALVLTGEAFAQTFIWPVDAPRVTQDYASYGAVIAGKFHTGIDITSAISAANNTQVLAAGAGSVIMASNSCTAGDTNCGGGWGNYVVIRHDNGVFTLYAHMASVSVSVGAIVTQGQAIGIMGATGNVTGAHIHFDILTSQPNTTSDFGPGYTTEHPAGLGHVDPRDYFVHIPVRVNTATLNVRKRPDSSDPNNIVTSVAQNQVYIATAQSPNGWYFVYLPSSVIPSPSTLDDDRYGWVVGASLVVNPFPTPAQVKVDGRWLWRDGATAIRVRSGAGTNFTELTKTWGGQSFVTFGPPTSGAGSTSSWYRIHLPANAGATAGWIAGDYLVVSGVYDDFEQYAAGSFPSAAWTSSGNTAVAVDNTTRVSGTNSLRLFGQVGGCWGSAAHRVIPVRPPFLIEFNVRNGSEALSGCHPTYGWVALNSGPNWSTLVRYLMAFYSQSGQRQIRGASSIAMDGTNPTGLFGPEMGSFESLTWYKASIAYEPVANGNVRLRYWLDGVLKGTFQFPALPYEADLVYLTIWAGEGSAWFDNVSVQPFAELAASVNTQNNLVVSWPAVVAGFDLVSATNANSPIWTLVSQPPTIVNGQNFVTNPITGSARFFRLRTR